MKKQYNDPITGTIVKATNMAEAKEALTPKPKKKKATKS